uniref:Putative RNA-binding protein n=1 Tax=Trypanosoma congolense (strain IL3000) TaxID=1068625 RepID=G0UQ23_TRYCI|nr:putative RNA-binding protein [Trypanosoma congolense IL3000]
MEPDPCNLIVNYIPTPVTEADLHALFKPFGALQSVRIIFDRSNPGQHKGYGFVRYRSVESAWAAMQHMDGYHIHNKRLRVTRARGPRGAIRAASEAMTPPPPGAGPALNPFPRGMSAACFGAVVDPAALSVQKVMPCHLLAPCNSSNSIQGVVKEPVMGEQVSAPATFAVVDNVPVQVVDASHGTVPGQANPQLLSTMPVSWPSCRVLQTREVAETNPANAHLQGKTSLDLSVMSMSCQSHNAFSASAATTGQLQIPQFPKLFEPIQFHSFIPMSPSPEVLLQGSVSSFFTPIGSSMTNHSNASCTGASNNLITPAESAPNMSA